jgi:hypothetical protein
MTVDNEDVQNVVKYIWRGVVTGKYYFSDETFDLLGPYDTLDAAVAKAVNKTNNLPQCNVKYYGG